MQISRLIPIGPDCLSKGDSWNVHCTTQIISHVLEKQGFTVSNLAQRSLNELFCLPLPPLKPFSIFGIFASTEPNS